MPTFESLIATTDNHVQGIAHDLRNFTLSLGPQVIEEIRAHRAAYAKTMNFRVFLELVPTPNSVNLVVRFGRLRPPLELHVTSAEELTAAKREIALGFEKIQ